VYSDPSGNGRTFLATAADGVYFTPNSGLTWYNSAPDRYGGVAVSYLCVAGPVDSPSDGGDVYVVGSDGYGYYTTGHVASNPSGGMTRYGDSTILLYSASIAHIAVDQYALPLYSNVLMGTNNNSSIFQQGGGLWRGVFDTTGNLMSGQSWIHE
jgi:hypothetical protein